MVKPKTKTESQLRDWASKLGEECTHPCRPLAEDIRRKNFAHMHKDRTWWHTDELAMDEYGPYTNREECVEGLKGYVGL